MKNDDNNLERKSCENQEAVIKNLKEVAAHAQEDIEEIVERCSTKKGIAIPNYLSKFKKEKAEQEYCKVVQYLTDNHFNAKAEQDEMLRLVKILANSVMYQNYIIHYLERIAYDEGTD